MNFFHPTMFITTTTTTVISGARETENLVTLPYSAGVETIGYEIYI